MMFPALRSALIAALLLGLDAHATDRVWLIGGGYDLENSQVQIEQNVLWARSVLRSLPGDRSIQTYFNDGDDPTPDVTLWRKPVDDAATMQPLARVYDADYANGEAVRSNTIAEIDGPATRQTLMKVLPDAITGLKPGEQGMFVYAGHGSPSDTGSRLDLWGEGGLTVRDLHKLVAAQPRETTLRFVFTQCFAGGFQIAILPQAGEPQRCGFYAVSADQPAEGCTASLDVAEYRGYGTYFFAALAGQARTGGTLLTEPDRDGDGRVNPYEAHLYTLRAARSTDLPRSSSEQYLLDWEPWYFPLLPAMPRDDNPYAELAVALAADADVAAPTRPTLHEMRKQIRARFQQLTDQQQQARSRAQSTMETLQADVERRWPGMRNSRTLAYKHFLEHDLDAAQAFIRAHDLYPKLVSDQDAYWELDNALLELQRRSALFDRIEFLEHLARLRDVFLDRASADERAVYQGLLDCEQRPL